MEVSLPFERQKVFLKCSKVLGTNIFKHEAVKYKKLSLESSMREDNNIFR